MRIQVAYALPDRQTVLTLEVGEGATIREAIESSGLLALHAELDPGKMAVGIWGRARTPDTPLKPGDRVEIYRPRQADPKAVRREKLGRRL